MLKESELVPPTVLARAQRYSETSGRPLWFVLLREGLLTDDKLFRLLEAQLKLPVLSDDQLDGVVVAPELKQAITGVLAGHLGILPLERSTDGRRAALAMVDPSQDLSTLLPKLASHGVVEVRRFLIRFGTLRLGMDMFYNLAWEPGESAPLIDSSPAPSPAPAEVAAAPTDAASSSKPEVSASKPEIPSSKPEIPASKPEIPSSKPEIPSSKPESASARSVRPVGGLSKPPRAQPPPLPPPIPPAVPNSPASESSHRGESARSSDGVPVPMAVGAGSSAHKSAISNRNITAKGLHRIEPPPIPKQAVPSPIAAVRSGPIRRRLLGDKAGGPSSADLIIEERPSNLNLSREVLRVPTRNLGISSFSDDQSVPMVDALFRCATALLEQLTATLDSDWPGLVSAHCTSLCDRIGILPRAQRELLLVARLHAVLTLQLVDKGPLPPPRKERLGYVCETPLDGTLAMLQSEFLDFVRLPQDDDPPLGMRIISTVLEALRLTYHGNHDDALASPLRQRHGDNDVVRTVLELFADQPPNFTDRTTPPGVRPRKLDPPTEFASPNREPVQLRLGWPKAESMPDVAWSCERVSSLPEEGLLPYPTRAEPRLPPASS